MISKLFESLERRCLLSAVPSTLVGRTLVLTVQVDVFQDYETSIFAFKSGTFTDTGPVIDNYGPGTFKYSKVGPSDAAVHLQIGDTVPKTINLHFTSATAGSYSFDDESGTLSSGIFSLVGGSASGTADLTCAVSLPSDADITVGQQDVATVSIGNTGTGIAAGKIGISLSLFSEAAQQIQAAVLSTTAAVRIVPGQTKNLPIKFTVPQTSDGEYLISANVNTTGSIKESNTGNDSSTTFETLTVSQASFSLTGHWISTPQAISDKKAGNAVISLVNAGNVTPSGTATVEVFASSDTTLSADDIRLATISQSETPKTFGHRPAHLKLKAPATLQPGTYFLIAKLSWSGTIADSNPADDVLVSQATITVQ